RPGPSRPDSWPSNSLGGGPVVNCRILGWLGDACRGQFDSRLSSRSGQVRLVPTCRLVRIIRAGFADRGVAARQQLTSRFPQTLRVTRAHQIVLKLDDVRLCIRQWSEVLPARITNGDGRTLRTSLLLAVCRGIHSATRES